MLITPPIVARRRAAAFDWRMACNSSRPAASVSNHPTRAAGNSARLTGAASARRPSPSVTTARLVIRRRLRPANASSSWDMSEAPDRRPLCHARPAAVGAAGSLTGTRSTCSSSTVSCVVVVRKTTIAFKVVQLRHLDSLRQETEDQNGDEDTDHRTDPIDPPSLPLSRDDRRTEAASGIGAGARYRRLDIHHDGIEKWKHRRGEGTNSSKPETHA